LWRRIVFLTVFAAHALYVGACAMSVPSGWTDFGINANAAGPLGFKAYWRGQDYFVGFSYALAVAFATWTLNRSIFFRQGRAVAAGAAAGGVTLVGALMAGGCFLIGCCGSPMLAVYLSLFGAKALGLGKPVMAMVTFVSVSCAYWCLSRRFARALRDRSCELDKIRVEACPSLTFRQPFEGETED
jgi:hypothetical protein